MSKLRSMRDQSGFAIGMILLVIVLIGAIVGAIAVSSKSTSSSGAGESAKVQSAALMQQGINLKNGFDVMTGRGVDAGSILWDVSASFGLFNPADGALPTQSPTPDVFSALASDTKQWVYKKDVSLMNVGTSSVADYVAVVPDISLRHCRYINSMLYGDALDATPAQGSSGTLAEWKDGESSSVSGGTDTPIDLSASASVDGRAEGCIATTDGVSRYVYYKTMVER